MKWTVNRYSVEVATKIHYPKRVSCLKTTTFRLKRLILFVIMSPRELIIKKPCIGTFIVEYLLPFLWTSYIRIMNSSPFIIIQFYAVCYKQACFKLHIIIIFLIWSVLWRSFHMLINFYPHLVFTTIFSLKLIWRKLCSLKSSHLIELVYHYWRSSLDLQFAFLNTQQK